MQQQQPTCCPYTLFFFVIRRYVCTYVKMWTGHKISGSLLPRTKTKPHKKGSGNCNTLSIKTPHQPRTLFSATGSYHICWAVSWLFSCFTYRCSEKQNDHRYEMVKDIWITRKNLNKNYTLQGILILNKIKW